MANRLGDGLIETNQNPILVQKSTTEAVKISFIYKNRDLEPIDKLNGDNLKKWLPEVDDSYTRYCSVHRTRPRACLNVETRYGFD